MSTRVKLPVFEVVEEAFKFDWRKLVALAVLNLTIELLFLVPLVILFFYVFADSFPGLSSVGDFEDGAVYEIPTADPNTSGYQTSDLFFPSGFWMVLGLMIFVLFLIFLIIGTQITRSITHGERLWLIKINRYTFRYFIALLIVLPLILLVELATAAPIIGALSLADNLDVSKPLLLVPAIMISAMIFVYFFARLWLFPVVSVAQERISFTAAFKAAKGNSWRIIGVWLVTFILMIVMFLVAQLVLYPLSILSGSTAESEVENTLAILEAFQQGWPAVIDYGRQIRVSAVFMVAGVLSFCFSATFLGP